MSTVSQPINALDKSARTSWQYAAVVSIASFLAICAVFYEESLGAYRVWVGNTTYQHCFLILPISLYMIWRRRGELKLLVPRPDLRALALIFPLSLAWSAASVLGILEAQQFVVLTIIQAMFLSVLGWPVYRKLIAPFLYLYFLVPTGAFLVPPLQDFTARFAVLGLQLVGVPVFSDGIIIEVPAGVFVVAEACAGLRFLIAAVAFGAFYATEMYQSIWRRLAFMVLSVVVPIIANGFRAFGLVLIAQLFDSAVAIEADHLTFGWVFFSIVLIALIFLGSAFSDRDRRIAPPKNESAPMRSASRKEMLILSGFLSVAIAGIFPIFFSFLNNASNLTTVPVAPPAVLSPWQVVGGEDPNWRPVVIGADQEFLQVFTDGEDAVYRFLALYRRDGPSDNLIRSGNRIADVDQWHFVKRSNGEVNVGGVMVPVNIDELVFGRRRLLVWSYYVVDGQASARLWDVKLKQARAYLAGGSCPTAMIAVAADITNDLGRTEATLRRFLSSSEPLDPYLCAER